MPTTILIAEDHAGLREMLRDWMHAEFPACHIRAVGSGEEAVALAQNEPPQLIIIDLGLPGINGLEATRQIRGANAAVRIVMLSLHDAACYRAGAAAAAAYVPKLRMRSELVPAVRALLTEPTQAKDKATGGLGRDTTVAGADSS